MSSTRGTPVLGSRGAHDVTDPTLHASDLEAEAPVVHNPTPGADGTIPLSNGTYWEAVYPRIPVLDEDPADPDNGQVWVRRRVSIAGTPAGLLLSLTQTIYPTAALVGTPTGLLLALTQTIYPRQLSIYDAGITFRMGMTP